jgi:predicted DNA-binding protein
MYTYIVERTQIYLSREQAAALDREAKRTGTTRSYLIREAIDRTYLATPDRERVLAALNASAGAWKGRRDDGEAYVEKLRTGRRWQDLYPDEPGTVADPTE